MDKPFWIGVIRKGQSGKGFLGGILVFALAAIALAGCQQATAEPTVTSMSPTATPTPVPPTPTPIPEPEYPTYANMPYSDDGDTKHMLDVYLPEGTEGSVATLFVVHGLRPPGAGIAPQGILTDEPKERLDRLGRYFAERGYAVVLIDYRQPSEPFQQWMTQDALCALAWVHAHADTYGFDRERIAVLGENWGAAIASNLVMVDDPDVFPSACPYTLPESDRVSGAITFGGLFLAPEFALEVGARISLFGSAQGIKSDIPLPGLIEVFETLRDHTPQEWRGGDELDQRTAEVARLLPLYWVHDSQVPFLLIDGPKELSSAFQVPSFEMRPSSEAESFAAALRQAGVNAETCIVDDAHFNSLMDPESSPGIFAAIEIFLADLSD